MCISQGSSQGTELVDLLWRTLIHTQWGRTYSRANVKSCKCFKNFIKCEMWLLLKRIIVPRIIHLLCARCYAKWFYFYLFYVKILRSRYYFYSHLQRRKEGSDRLCNLLNFAVSGPVFGFSWELTPKLMLLTSVTLTNSDCSLLNN